MQFQLQQLHGAPILKPRGSFKLSPTTSISLLPNFSSSSLRFPSPSFHPLASSHSGFSNVLRLRTRSIAMCNMNDADLIPQLELGNPVQSRNRPEKRVNGKLVEEEEGNLALWISYILTGVGANIISWLILPGNAVSVGASGAVFGLFTISVLVKMSWDWRKILEVLILGQFVIEKVFEAAQASTELSGSFRGGYAVQNVNHVAHLSGALVGVFLVWLLSRLPSQSPDQDASDLHRK